MSEHAEIVEIAKRVPAIGPGYGSYAWINRLAEAVIEMAGEIERLKDNLQRYGMHHCPCSWHTGDDTMCDCGFHDALSQPAEKEKRWT